MSSITFSNRSMALVAACVLLCAGCSMYKQHPVLPGASVPAKNLRIAVLPLVNLSGKPAPLKDIRQALIEGVVAAGGLVIDDDSLETFMARHRVRYTGGIDTSTAQALKQEAGVEAVLITSLERYVDTTLPQISMTSRLVSTENMPPRILWMESSILSGNDSPGLLGLGLIKDIGRLRKKAIKGITASLAGFLSGKVTAGDGGGIWRFHPKLAYFSRFLVPGRRYRVAIAPFFNKSEVSFADQIMALHFTRQLVKTGAFEVVDPGVVREKLLKARVIMRAGVSKPDEDILFNTMDADLILTGKVLNYDDAAPGVEFYVVVFDRTSMKVVWSSWSSSRGDDGVFFFDWGSVNTVGKLASKMASNVVRDITSRGLIKDARQIQEKKVTNEKWTLTWKYWTEQESRVSGGH
jgi:hypothetical protein